MSAERDTIKCGKCGRGAPEVGFYEVAFMKIGSAMFGKENSFPIICSDCFRRIMRAIENRRIGIRP